MKGDSLTGCPWAQIPQRGCDIAGGQLGKHFWGVCLRGGLCRGYIKRKRHWFKVQETDGHDLGCTFLCKADGGWHHHAALLFPVHLCILPVGSGPQVILFHPAGLSCFRAFEADLGFPLSVANFMRRSIQV